MPSLIAFCLHLHPFRRGAHGEWRQMFGTTCEDSGVRGGGATWFAMVMCWLFVIKRSATIQFSVLVLVPVFDIRSPYPSLGHQHGLEVVWWWVSD